MRTMMRFRGKEVKDTSEMEELIKAEASAMAEDFYKNLTINVAYEMKALTPVKSGHASSSCQIGVNDRFPEYDRFRTGDHPVDISMMNDFRLGDKLTVRNAAPYAIDLEYGLSDQAPNGMIRLVVQDITSIVGWTIGMTTNE